MKALILVNNHKSFVEEWCYSTLCFSALALEYTWATLALRLRTGCLYSLWSSEAMARLCGWLTCTPINGAAWLRDAACILLKPFLHSPSYRINQFTLFLWKKKKKVNFFSSIFFSLFSLSVILPDQYSARWATTQICILSVWVCGKLIPLSWRHVSWQKYYLRSFLKALET